MIKSFEEFQSLGKDNLEASVASATAMTKGFQNAAVEMTAFSRKAFEQGTEAMDKVLSAKSVDKAVEAQQSFAQDAYATYLGQVSRLGEIYLDAAREAYKPFEAQFARFNGKAAGK